jgi:cyclic pyranopterin phosphate synthase
MGVLDTRRIEPAGSTPSRTSSGRPLHDLRISVTDRCNFRCTYCMPKEIFGPDFAFLPKGEVLTFEEIERVARAFVELGVEKLRITGGEPLVRRDLPVLISMLAALRRPDGGELDLTLTTNGSALRKLAPALRDAGLQRVTVSLDSLDDEVFSAMNGVDFPVAKVLDGIAAARETGLAPVKVNMVVRRGLNEASILPMARWARCRGRHAPLYRVHGRRPHERLAARRGRVGRRHRRGDRRRDAARAAAGAVPWRGRRPLAIRRGDRRRRGRRDRVGQPAVLRRLHRARISAEGKLYTCLFSAVGHDLRAVVRDADATDVDLREAIARVWRVRDDRYSDLRTEATSDLPRVEMFAMGG